MGTEKTSFTLDRWRRTISDTWTHRRIKDLDLRFFGVIIVILQCLVLCKIDILDTSILPKSLALSIQRASYERALLTDYCCRSQWVFYSSRTFETLPFKDPEPNFRLGRQDFYCDRQPDASLMLLRSKWLFLVLEIVHNKPGNKAKQ